MNLPLHQAVVFELAQRGREHLVGDSANAIFDFRTSLSPLLQHADYDHRPFVSAISSSAFC